MKSPAWTNRGAPPTANGAEGTNVPAPVPRSTETVRAWKSAVTRSSVPFRSRSAAVIDESRTPIGSVRRGAKRAVPSFRRMETVPDPKSAVARSTSPSRSIAPLDRPRNRAGGKPRRVAEQAVADTESDEDRAGIARAREIDETVSIQVGENRVVREEARRDPPPGEVDLRDGGSGETGRQRESRDESAQPSPHEKSLRTLGAVIRPTVRVHDPPGPRSRVTPPPAAATPRPSPRAPRWARSRSTLRRAPRSARAPRAAEERRPAARTPAPA